MPDPLPTADLACVGVESFSGSDTQELLVGLGGVRRHGCVAVCSTGQILGVCEQERINRIRASGFNPTGLPDEALDELLRRSHRLRRDITRFAMAEEPLLPLGSDSKVVSLGHHFSHACAAFLTSPFEFATIVVCDHDAPQVTVWQGNSSEVSAVDWPWSGPGFAQIYTQAAEAIGFVRVGGDQEMEAMARLDPSRHDSRVDQLFSVESDRLRVKTDWQVQLESFCGRSQPDRMSVAASIQSRIGDLLIEFLSEVMRRRCETGPICLGGSLFLNSYFNTRVKLFARDVFIPVNPANAGLAVGCALYLQGGGRHLVSPFLGPRYDHQEIKATLDNCKLDYEWVPQSKVVEMAVEDLLKGRLVGWFGGAMEWGPRSLGARSILASPFSPHVLDNLNRFLKQREPWRGYALSGLSGAIRQHFEGPDDSPLMESDYIPRDPEMFRHVLPSERAGVRVQTVRGGAPILFQELLEAFGRETGCPILVNTSFNGFREPIVCTPRDAVRVFFGTGIDTLVLDKFIIRK